MNAFFFYLVLLTTAAIADSSLSARSVPLKIENIKKLKIQSDTKMNAASLTSSKFNDLKIKKPIPPLEKEFPGQFDKLRPYVSEPVNCPNRDDEPRFQSAKEINQAVINANIPPNSYQATQKMKNPSSPYLYKSINPSSQTLR